jgi:hypothetical protein
MLFSGVARRGRGVIGALVVHLVDVKRSTGTRIAEIACASLDISLAFT